ncbi:MAG TPA: hypothetical protein VI542_37265, partial [Candidatus Tectomicrobia bacterium]
HYLQQTGDTAARQNAYPEAIIALSKGLALLTTLPDSAARARHELALQLALGALLLAMKGRTAPEVGEAYTRAHALGQQVGEPLQCCQALWGLVQFHAAMGQLRSAGELSQQLFHLAQQQSDPKLVLDGHLALGHVLLYQGDFPAARTHLEYSLDRFNPLQSTIPTFRDGFVSEVFPLCRLVQALWPLGYADQAWKRVQEALVLARHAEHPLSQLYAELWAALLSQWCRDVAATQAHAETAMDLATIHGSALRVEQGRILCGWALVMQGEPTTGMAHMHQGWVASQSLGGPPLLNFYWLSMLAEAHGRMGRPEVGLTVLAEALTLLATTEARWWEAELYRLKGALLLQLPRPDVPQAETCVRQALEVARGQQAKTLELRAALTLSRLWQQQSKQADAQALLAPIYGWFTEGFDTADLQEAKSLLADLT